MKDKTLKKVSVIGLGYMGLPIAILIANAGHEVVGVDKNEDKVEFINRGIPPFTEDGLESLLGSIVSTKKFKAQSQVENADIYIVSVPTPLRGNRCDLSYVIDVCTSVSDVAHNKELLIIESTVKPKTCEEHILPIFLRKNIDIEICHCPERAIPGNAFHELTYNDRIVGGLTNQATEMAANFYASFVKGEIFKTTAINAECIKLMENTYRDVNIALANEFDNIADDIGFDVYEAIHLANKHPRVNILSPGPGVGGHCIPIDPCFLIESTNRSQLIKLSREINDNRPNHFGRLINDKLMQIGGNKVGFLGIAYKKNVDDTRESPAHRMAEILTSLNIEIRGHDPYIKKWKFPLCPFDELSSWSDLLVLVTDHDKFLHYKINKPIIDTRYFLAKN